MMGYKFYPKNQYKQKNYINGTVKLYTTDKK